MMRLLTITLFAFSVAACSSNQVKCGTPYTIIDAASNVPTEQHSQSTEK